jgi:hypothetical protein
MGQISMFLQRRLLRCRGTLRVPAGTCNVPLRISTWKEFPKAGSGLWQSAFVFAAVCDYLFWSGNPHLGAQVAPQGE